MVRKRRPDLNSFVAAAAAQDFNDELTIIFSAISEMLCYLEADHPARELMLDARRASQRCAFKSYEILNFTRHLGIGPMRGRLGSFF